MRGFAGRLEGQRWRKMLFCIHVLKVTLGTAASSRWGRSSHLVLLQILDQPATIQLSMHTRKHFGQSPSLLCCKRRHRPRLCCLWQQGLVFRRVLWRRRGLRRSEYGGALPLGQTRLFVAFSQFEGEIVRHPVASSFFF